MSSMDSVAGALAPARRTAVDPIATAHWDE